MANSHTTRQPQRLILVVLLLDLLHRTYVAQSLFCLISVKTVRIGRDMKRKVSHTLTSHNTRRDKIYLCTVLLEKQL